MNIWKHICIFIYEWQLKGFLINIPCCSVAVFSVHRAVYWKAMTLELSVAMVTWHQMAQCWVTSNHLPIGFTNKRGNPTLVLGIIFIENIKTIFVFPVISQLWDGTDNPSLWKTRQGLSQINTVAADEVVMQGATISTAMADYWSLNRITK